MTSRTGSPIWLILATGLSGVGTYALLVVVARAVGPVAYADFSVFWAAILIVALGVFLPLEQETARRVARLVATGPAASAVWRRATWIAVATAGVAIVIGGLSAVVAGGRVVQVIAFGIACVGYALQFPARGVLSGQRRLAQYGLVFVVDNAARVLAAIGLWLSGTHSADLYALVIAGSSVFAGVVAVGLAGAWRRPLIPAPVEGFLRNGSRLVLAAACMQALLNSGTLVAKGFAPPSDAALAGHLLAMMTIARLPVFLLQALQPAYLARLSAGVHHGDAAAVRRLLWLLATLVGVIAVGIVAGAAALGPWAVRVLFGPGFEVTRQAAVLVAVSVAVYVMASVTNDASIAVGAHARIAIAWPLGLAIAALAVLLLTDLVVRSTLPLTLGAAIATVVLVPGLRRHLRR